MATQVSPTRTTVALVVCVVLGLVIAPGVATATTTDDENATSTDGDDALVNATVETVDAVLEDTQDALDSEESPDDGTADSGETNVDNETATDEGTTTDGAAADEEMATDDADAEDARSLAVDGPLAVDANGSLVVDADGSASANESLTLDADASLGDGALDASVQTTVGHGGVTFTADVDGASTAGVREIGASQDGTEQDDGEAHDRGESGDEEATGDAGSNTGDGSDDAPGSGAGAGLAIGSMLVGGGVLARRIATDSVATGGAGGGSLVSTASAWVRAWGWRILAFVGYQRFDGSDPLEHGTRAELFERIEAEPGVCRTELAETVDVPLSTLRYHLRILAHEDLIDSETVRGKRRYVPATVDRDALDPALADDATAAVLQAIALEPDSVSGLADRLDRDPSTVTHHLQRLDEAGLVEREREGRAVVSRLADDVDPTEVVGAAPTPAD